jgi:PKD repeat protein
MDKQLQKNAKRASWKTWILGLFLWGTVAPVLGQMSGVYTIDNTQAASSSNFRNFQSLANQLAGLSRTDGGPGITGAGTWSGNITVNVGRNSGPYNEQVVWRAPLNNTGGHRVQLNGRMRTVTFNGTTSSKFTMQFNGASNITIDSLDIEGTNATNAFVVHFIGGANNIIIENSIVEAPNITNTSTSTTLVSALIAFSNSATTLTTSTTTRGRNGFNVTIRNNHLRGGTNNAGPSYGVYMAGQTSDWTSFNYNNSIINNKIQNCYFRYIYLDYIGGTHITGNEFWRSTSPSVFPYFNFSQHAAIWCNYAGQSLTRGTLIEGNYIHDLHGNSIPGVYYKYYEYPIYLNWVTGGSTGSMRFRVNANRIENNYADYYYGLYQWYSNNTDVTNNLIVGNTRGFFGYWFMNYYLTNSNIEHNTLIDNQTYNTAGVYFFYNVMNANSNSRLRSNMVVSTANGTRYAHYFNSAVTNWAEINHNNYWFQNGTFLMTNNIGTFANWQANTGVGTGERNLDPNFRNPSTLDYRSNNFELNNVAPLNQTSTDYNNVTRNRFATDIGAFENPTDVKLDSFLWTSSTTCAGYNNTVRIRLTNNFPATARNIPVAFRLGNGPKIRELISVSINSGASAYYTFNAPANWRSPGTDFQSSISAFIDVPDDNLSNDTITYAVSVGAPASGSTFNLTKGVSDRSWDVTNLNNDLVYSVTPPSAFGNSTYNAANGWIGSAWATSLSGRTMPASYTTWTPPTAGANGTITFRPTNSNDEDTFCFVYLKITRRDNGCDTTLRYRVKINPTGIPGFTVPALKCDGDPVLFSNTSTVKSGALDYIWHFGDGDTSIASNPVHQYKSPGTYNVRLITLTTPYGFRKDTTIQVTVNAVPSVNFDKTNVCLGGTVSFVNRSTPTTGTTYLWEFGEGAARSTAVNPTYRYTNVGAYVVKLTASLNGCSKEFTKNLYVFPKPKADFVAVKGSCENEPFTFNNRSSVSSGELGYIWNFDDNGAVATLKDVSYDFNTSGVKNVKLKAISEFGCEDSMVKPIDVKAAPAASFTNTAACSITPTTFTNTTAPKSGWTPSYSWNFGDGTTSTAASPVKNWTNLGPKNVTLKVMLNNGCSDQITRTLNVGTQPVAAFSAENTCAGQPMTFVNSTTWPQGDITYLWNFADGNTSNNSDPLHTYNVNSTRVFNVTLYAFIKDGCADSITKQVTVNEGPKTCDFEANINYSKGFRGVDFTPVSSQGIGAQDGVSYTWIYDQEGQSRGPAGYNNFQEDGVYRVTMRARNVNGCECVAVKTISINRRGVEDATGLEARINLYPNPNNGMFKVVVGAEAQHDLNIAVYNILGAKVADVPTNGRSSGIFDVNASELSNGIYLVKITSGGQTAIRKVNIQR